ncbi:MAG: N-6 DNA methylase [Acidimicrobiaceae bacterium]|nr:N-6 DNA methylase [Acidimicrobiaceae bacterium]
MDEPLRISRKDILNEAARLLWSPNATNGTTADALGTAFDVFLRRRYDNSGGLGTYLTPGNVVDLMVKIGFQLLLQDSSPDRARGLMGDPCCGSGRFLIGLRNGARDSLSSTRDNSDELLFGADQSSSSVAMARVNLLASGVKQPQVYLTPDSITSSWLSTTNGRFSLILTNPPFGDKQYDSREGIAKTAKLMPRLSGADRIDPALAFVARSIELLSPGGVLGIILPDGLIDGRTMRELLLGPPRIDTPIGVEGIVSLPSVTFAPAGTTAKTSILFIRKSHAEATKRVFLARADHVGYLMSKGTPVSDESGDDLPHIAQETVDCLRMTKPNTNTLERVRIESFGRLNRLDASSIDHSALKARELLLERGGVQAEEILTYAGRSRATHAAQEAFVSVLHVDNTGVIDWVSADKHRPSTPGQTALPGQIIVSLLNPRKFRVAVIPQTCGSVQCSIEFGVFQPKIDPYVALVLLQHSSVRSQAAPLGRGTSSSRRRIDAQEVLDLILPPYSEVWAARIGPQVRRYLEQIYASHEGIHGIYSEFNDAKSLLKR